MKNKKKKDINNQSSNSESKNLDKDQSVNSELPNFDQKDELESRLSEIKKLASEFYIGEESGENQERPEISDTENDEDTFGDAYLDRLSDFQIDNNYVSVISSAEDVETRNKETNEQESEPLENKNKEEIIKPHATEFSALPSPNVEHEVNQSFFIRKKSFSIDDLEEKVDELLNQTESNDEFVNEIRSSLKEEGESNQPATKSGTEFKTFDEDSDDNEKIQELEQEIDNAIKVTNPFFEEVSYIENDDFLNNLNKLSSSNGEILNISESEKQEENEKDDLMLSSHSWHDLLELTDEDNFSNSTDPFIFEQDQNDPIFSKDKTENNQLPFLPSSNGEKNRSLDENNNEFQSDFSDLDNGLEKHPVGVDSLRKSFIDDFNSSEYEEDIETDPKKNRLSSIFINISKWFKSQSTSEKILIFLSFFISLAVIVSIILVITQWSINNRRIANPPPAIESTDQDLIYPTGLELTGGWFFFLERGEIQENKWEPQNAEWLANTKLRRVIAVPWSNQSESVVRSLTTADEISLFMNNNDIVVYQVEEVIQISRDNVRILSDTEPSLVVILFREDNEDRWTVIAKPKPIE